VLYRFPWPTEAISLASRSMSLRRRIAASVRAARDIRGEGETFTIYHPAAASPTAFTSITVAPNGDFIRYVDRRGGVTVPSLPPGATRSQIDSVFAAARRQNRTTSINIDYRKGTVLLANEGGGKSDSRLMASIGEIARNPKFGSPALQANAILARCRGSGT
jgi:hypothetical protein